MKTKGFPVVVVVLAAMMAGAHYMAFVYAPVEVSQGPLQKIFYFHVPSAMMCYLGFICCALGSVGYLWSRSTKWDIFALAGAEVGLLFGLIVLTTGPLWARPEWGHWWKWEPRLTTMSLLVLMYGAYWVLRSFGGSGEGVRRFAAALGIFGAPNIYFVHVAVKWWRGDHPEIKRGDMNPDMKMALYSAMLTISVVFVILLWMRYRAQLDRRTASALRRRLARVGGMR